MRRMVRDRWLGRAKVNILSNGESPFHRMACTITNKSIHTTLYHYLWVDSHSHTRAPPHDYIYGDINNENQIKQSELIINNHEEEVHADRALNQ